MKAPRVTVLMTLYNKGPWVAEAVRSVLAQTFTDFELLVVDDASTDDGPEIVNTIRDERIILLSNRSNTGRASAANRGYDAARGEFVAVLDADDRMLPERLVRQVDFLGSNPDIGIVGSYARTIGATEGVAKWPERDKEARARMLFGDPLLYGTAMLRTNVLRENGHRCMDSWKHPGMDYLFLIGLAMHTKVATIPEVLTEYRIGEQNFRHGRDRTEDRARIYREAFKLFGMPCTSEQLELQLMLHNLFMAAPTVRKVSALAERVQELVRLNREAGVFDEHVFASELKKRWESIFFPLADRGIPTALAHCYYGRSWSLLKFKYMLAMMRQRWVGKFAPRSLE